MPMIRLSAAAHEALKEWTLPGHVLAEPKRDPIPGDCVIKVDDEVAQRLDDLRAQWGEADYSGVILHLLARKRSGGLQ